MIPPVIRSLIPLLLVAAMPAAANAAPPFTNIGAGLTPLWGGSAQWGDFDGDDDLDVLICGRLGETFTTRVFRNPGSVPFVLHAELPGALDARWGDYDNDGDLDIVGYGVYRNDGGASPWCIPPTFTGRRSRGPTTTAMATSTSLRPAPTIRFSDISVFSRTRARQAEIRSSIRE
jgi:hypothetical protein